MLLQDPEAVFFQRVPVGGGMAGATFPWQPTGSMVDSDVVALH
jgi:hypothetical protein